MRWSELPTKGKYLASQCIMRHIHMVTNCIVLGSLANETQDLCQRNCYMHTRCLIGWGTIGNIMTTFYLVTKGVGFWLFYDYTCFKKNEGNVFVI